ncbi:chromosome-associated kinesin KIF4B [Trichonephila clavata]|uniref:Chromosome-associated kinesin KIF4B n=1 Tax=Trichonephila clavata TaxID=2740835 RepID=A0A8X6FL68_TRICU|nr:chromosome-associated kinesin KIF4B [Trichonephila clavata]
MTDWQKERFSSSRGHQRFLKVSAAARRANSEENRRGNVRGLKGYFGMARQINISSSLRCRPLIAKERPALYPIYFRGNAVSVDRRLYTFDRVFDQRSKNEKIFKELVFDKIDDLIQGYNVAFMTYGPTKTGKSYTMGTFYNRQKEIKDPGIIPRTVREIFKRIRKDEQYSVKVSFVEVIYEEVYDLLVDPTVERVVKENDARDAFEIECLLEITTQTANEALDVLAKGISTRSGIANFAKNLRSPRAHLLYTLTLEVRQNNLPVRVSKMHFVEIGTAERVSSPEPRRQKKPRGRPLQGLVTFNKIINNLTMDKKILPYRESKLTSILKETLGGNCITVLIVCVSNVYGKTESSVEPIRISSTARRVINKPIINALNPEEQRRFIEREAENNERRQEAERNANKRKNKGDDAVAGPSCSGDATFRSISEEREIDYLYVPGASSESTPEQIDEDYEDDDPHGTIIFLK